MPDEQSSDKTTSDYQIPFKELAVYIPILCSALALTWEVGSFMPIAGSAFGIFSLTEHFVFAAQALPLLMIAAVTVSIFVTNYRYRWSSSRPVARIVFGLFSILGVGVGILIGVWLPQRGDENQTIPWLFIGVSWFGYIVYMAMRLTDFRFWPKSKTIVYLLSAAYIMALILTIGILQTQLLVKQGQSSKIETAKGQRNLVVIRAGQSGILGFDQVSNRFLFIKRDEIKERSWPKMRYF